MRWSRAFVYAVKAVLASLLFIVIGYGLIAAGVAAGVATRHPMGFVFAAVLAVIGAIVVMTGMLIALFKYMPEAVAEEVREKVMRS